jgi:hypothetical protein
MVYRDDHDPVRFERHTLMDEVIAAETGFTPLGPVGFNRVTPA